MLVGISTKLAITSLVSSSDRKRETSLLCGAKVSPDDAATLQGHWYCIFLIYYTLTNLRGMTLVLKYFSLARYHPYGRISFYRVPIPTVDYFQLRCRQAWGPYGGCIRAGPVRSSLWPHAAKRPRLSVGPDVGGGGHQRHAGQCQRR